MKPVNSQFSPDQISAFSRWYHRYIKPRSHDEDVQRREFIFNVLLLGSIVLVLIAFLIMVEHVLALGDDYDGLSPAILSVPLIVLGGLYRASRRGFKDLLPYIFVGLFWILGTYALYLYGYVLPEGLMTYSLVIVMAAMLISIRGSLIMTVLIVLSLAILSYLQEHGISRPDMRHILDPLTPGNVVLFGSIFGVILLVAWLSTRDIERSLQRARRSEAELRRERNSLEVKVRQRTQELERVQVEKMMELYRFAEFGRISSTLLHELANPLTSVSLELEQLESSGHAAVVRQARKGIAYMEQYVAAARRQLRNQSELRWFDSAVEIKRVVEFLTARAQKAHVPLETALTPHVKLHGDSIRFNQIMANLIANAIDANDTGNSEMQKVVISSSVQQGSLCISVQDWGTGITRSQLKTIFEPFFTTKGVERGSGIGLSITKRTVEEDFGGSIEVISSPQGGTCFTVRLPLRHG